MIETLNILNIKTGREIELRKDGKSCFYLDTIDWDAPSVTFGAYKTMTQIGETISSVSVKTREPSIVGYVIADVVDAGNGSTWEEYYQEQKRRIEAKKKELNKIINIFQDIVLQVGDYKLNARPSCPVRYSIKEKENNEVLCYFKIELTCFDPLFYKDMKQVSFSRLVKKFHFPLVFKPPKHKVVFGLNQKRQVILIENNGDTDTGCLIRIKATGGSVKDPKFYNTETGEQIGFTDVLLQDGDYIVINTETRKEDALLYRKETGEIISLVGYTDKGSKYLKLKQGAWYYSYTVDEQYKNNIDVSVSFFERFFNIEVM